jgi:hypothetical protein
VALATGELTGLITDLVAALGGEAEPGQPSASPTRRRPATARTTRLRPAPTIRRFE